MCGDVIVGLMCRVGLEALYLIKMMTLLAREADDDIIDWSATVVI